jgi:hypothetical protein
MGCTKMAKSEAKASGAAELLTSPVSVVNVGLEGFATELKTLGVPVVHVQWQPPAGGDAKLAALLGKLGT